jgi:quinoprotein glucose dehydrogenase
MKPAVVFMVAFSFSAAVVAGTESRIRAATGQATGTPRGMYTEAQRKRGETVYTTACASCHGSKLGGSATVPGLAGDDFLDSWIGKTAADLLERSRTSEPLPSHAALSAQEHVDVLAYILSRNNFAAGPAELAGDAASLRAIQLDDSHATPADPGSTRSVLDGVYAEAQSKQGAAVYAAACASCHAPTLAGRDVVPALMGADFLDHWTGTTAGDLFQRIQRSMPQDKPGTLSEQEYVDVLAYIFLKNRFPPGDAKLDGDQAVLNTIRIETAKKAR